MTQMSASLMSFVLVVSSMMASVLPVCPFDGTVTKRLQNWLEFLFGNHMLFPFDDGQAVWLQGLLTHTHANMI